MLVAVFGTLFLISCLMVCLRSRCFSAHTDKAFSSELHTPSAPASTSLSQNLPKVSSASQQTLAPYSQSYTSTIMENSSNSPARPSSSSSPCASIMTPSTIILVYSVPASAAASCEILRPKSLLYQSNSERALNPCTVQVYTKKKAFHTENMATAPLARMSNCNSVHQNQ